MDEETKKFIRQHIAELKQSIESEEAKKALSQDPVLLQRIKYQDSEKIKKLVADLGKYRDKLSPFVQKIGEQVHSITEETPVCACYLLAAQTFKLWDAVLSLGKTADYVAIMIIIRAIKEHTMLVELLASEYQDGDDDKVRKWFAGDIVRHAEGRAKMIPTLKSLKEFSTTDEKEIKNFVTSLYNKESLFAHPSYASVLEGVSPFTKNFDFDEYTAIHRTVSVLEYGPMVNTNIALKFIFGLILKDLERYKELDEILKQYQPNIDLKKGIARISQ